jgi:hypothetical protein
VSAEEGHAAARRSALRAVAASAGVNVSAV